MTLTPVERLQKTSFATEIFWKDTNVPPIKPPIYRFAKIVVVNQEIWRKAQSYIWNMYQMATSCCNDFFISLFCLAGKGGFKYYVGRF